MVTSRTARVATLAILATLLARSAAAQASAHEPAMFETRPELQAAVVQAEQEHRPTEAALLQSRLQHGDFQEGDKILLTVDIPVVQPASLSDSRRPGDDTVVVRTGKMLHFSDVPNIPDLSLEGVLRSELTDAVTAHLGKYIRDPRVRAVPLLRVAVLGAVVKPGWYATRTDVVLSDLLMQAGGVNAESDVSKTLIRRAGETIWSADQVRTALADGSSLDQLNLQAGDEVYVGQRRQFNLLNVVQLLAGVTAIYVAVRAFHQPR